MNQIEAIKSFCDNAKYYYVTFENTKNGEIGKIINSAEIGNLTLDQNEIRRSIEYKNEDRLFVYDTKPHNDSKKIDNPLQLIINNKKEMEIIEGVYPGMFTWVFDGVSIKAYAIVPSGNPKSHSTISRYGGTEMFIKIIRKHLENLSNLYNGGSPDYRFFKDNLDIQDTEISIGSVNTFNGLFSVQITPKMTYMEILLKSKNNVQEKQNIKHFDMKYWAREINPDFINEAKQISISNTLTIDEGWLLYPKVIRKLMALKDKGNYNRFLLTRFLLSVHKPHEAKFVYYSVLSPEELEHVKNGNCSTQWNYVMNNRKRYDCPTMKELNAFRDADEDLSHPLENIQKYLNKKYGESEDGNDTES